MEEVLMVTTLAQFQALSLVFAQYKFSPSANVFHFPQRQFGEGAQANKANFVNGFASFYYDAPSLQNPQKLLVLMKSRANFHSEIGPRF